MEHLWKQLREGVTPFHVTQIAKEYLMEQGFIPLEATENFSVQAGKGYVIQPYPSALLAVTIGENLEEERGMRLALAHTDFPCLKVKPSPELTTKKYHKLNIEGYGGLIKETWFDRPLGLAGKVVLAGRDVFHPEVRYVNFGKPVAMIPNLAPHLSRGTDKKDINIQQEMMPLVGMVKEHWKPENFFYELLAEELEVEAEEILDFDLYLYNADQPELVGFSEEFLSSPRLDNVMSVAALTEGIATATGMKGIYAIALFDNEEIGSRSKQGADSNLLSYLLTKVLRGILEETSPEDYLMKSFMVSVDAAHALHPNYLDKSDLTNEIFLNKGVVIKSSASQRYVSDSEAAAIVMQLCRQAQIPYQRTVNRSNIPGGQTLGPIAASYLPMQACDMGIPLLAMHSARELAGVEDYESLVTFITSLFQE